MVKYVPFTVRSFILFFVASEQKIAVMLEVNDENFYSQLNQSSRLVLKF